MCKEIMNGSALDVFEIDAASHTGVDNVREIIDGVRFAPNKGKYKVYIIDEVHMLSTAAFNALLKTLEEPPAHAVFIMATTEVHKVPATVVSRCQRFDFRRFTPTEIVGRLKEIAKAEKVKVADEVLYEIARHAEGCERDAESLLGQLLALGEKEISLDEATLVLPVAYTETVLKFIEAIGLADAGAAIRVLNEGVEQGMDIPSFLDNVVLLLRTILFGKLGGLERFQEAYEAGALERLGALSSAWSVNKLTEAIELFLSARRSSKNDSIPQLAAELMVLKLVAVTNIFFPPKIEVAVKTDVASTKVLPEIPSTKIETVTPSRLVSLDEIKNKWNELCDQIQEKSPSLVLVLRDAEISEVRGPQVELKFAFALHADTVNRGKNKKIIDDTLSSMLGTPLSIQAVFVPPTAEADEAVAILSEAFGGSMV
jgi:DNA polymerase-3 subunit gamma/tau